MELNLSTWYFNFRMSKAYSIGSSGCYAILIDYKVYTNNLSQLIATVFDQNYLLNMYHYLCSTFNDTKK